jgi:gluconate 2-dehydrogenase gamma chain
MAVEGSDGGLGAAFEAAIAAVVERILPSDDGTPGALETRAAHYVCAVAANPSLRSLYSDGVARIDARAGERFGRRFTELAGDQQDEILRAAEAGELGPGTSAFFELARVHTIEGSFGDPRHGGNAGMAGWKLVGYPGPRLEIGAHEQALDAASSGPMLSAAEIEPEIAARTAAR